VSRQVTLHFECLSSEESLTHVQRASSQKGTADCTKESSLGWVSTAGRRGCHNVTVGSSAPAMPCRDRSRRIEGMIYSKQYRFRPSLCVSLRFCAHGRKGANECRQRDKELQKQCERIQRSHQTILAASTYDDGHRQKSSNLLLYRSSFSAMVIMIVPACKPHSRPARRHLHPMRLPPSVTS
jgi:hypothetical protein